MRIFEILNEGYKEAQAEFATKDDPEVVKQAISDYRKLVDRNQVQGDERNIDSWRKKGWEQFKQFVDSKANTVSKSQIKQARIPGGESIVLKKDKDWLITVPMNKAASCNLGSGTDWCTTKFERHHYERYAKLGVVLIYCIHSSGKKWALAMYPDHIASESGVEYELFDINDNKLSDTEFYQQTGLTPFALMKAANANKQVRAYRDKQLELPIDVLVDKMKVGLDYEAAKAYCRSFGNGWRLPTESELFEINKSAQYFHWVEKQPVRYWESNDYDEPIAVAFDEDGVYTDYFEDWMLKYMAALPVKDKSK
jgi:hypothetical protein